MIFVSPADYVYTPLVEPGEYEIDSKYGHAQTRPGDDQLASHSLGLGATIGERWFTEVYAKWEQSVGEGHHFDAIEWENRLQLTERGAQAYELGLVAEIERPKDRREGYEVRVGGLFQTAARRWQLNANLLLTRNFAAEAGVAPQLGYQLQLKYRLAAVFEPGLQLFGAAGDAAHWLSTSEQYRVAGPALFGAIPVGVHQRLRYNAAWLRALTATAPRNTLRVQVEFEF
jgi:hypothetical protein